MNVELRNGFADHLREAGHAHHTAYAATNGEDVDWAIWYADYLRNPLAENLQMNFHQSQLIYCLMDADFEHQARSPDSDWAEYYASEIVERYAPSESPAADKLSLYHYDGCPFCSFTRNAIDRLGIDVELRNIFEDSQHRDDLISARGRATVPVLRVSSPDGDDRWMPESRDIVSYLKTTYG
jgi:glutaredoxin